MSSPPIMASSCVCPEKYHAPAGPPPAPRAVSPLDPGFTTRRPRQPEVSRRASEIFMSGPGGRRTSGGPRWMATQSSTVIFFWGVLGGGTEGIPREP